MYLIPAFYPTQPPAFFDSCGFVWEVDIHVEVVLVLGLLDHGGTGLVVGLAFTATLVLRLEALEVSFVLVELDERLWKGSELAKG